MTTLALEFSSNHRSAAVWVPATAEAPGRSGHATHTCGRETPAFALIQAALDEAGVGREDLDRIAIGLGPGSATGVRTAIAISEGWRLGRRIGLVGLSSLECLAARLHGEGIRGVVQVAVDAQRNEFHLASFELAPEGLEAREPLRLANADEVRTLVASGAKLLGPGIARLVPGAHDAYPDALTLARLGAGREAAGEEVVFDAIHLRQPAYAKLTVRGPAARPR